jgi:hypothetical protein
MSGAADDVIEKVHPNAPVTAIGAVFEHSGDWDTSAWSTPSLILTQAALRHMLKIVEREMGQRKLIAPHRETR